MLSIWESLTQSLNPRFVMSDCVVQVYGSYCRKLSKKVQTELAEANAIAQEVIGNMTTVRGRGLGRC
jgi:ABC-type multidrug transport system fused ATPase/permease subunit